MNPLALPDVEPHTTTHEPLNLVVSRSWPDQGREHLVGLYNDSGELGVRPDGAGLVIRRARNFVLVAIDVDPDVDEIHYDGTAVDTLERAHVSIGLALDAVRKGLR